ncbi:hypothetical protein DPMN_100393 [Dreissena polymorpha]|uniref:Uncharacterized protein n=1 Tax=Dreissena polymorpha TaxID=45954 RepID=A0A9D4LHG6_DREPO|nr:hypothetical protein DPMN_100393 [Dreissena polymorpha]
MGADQKETTGHAEPDLPAPGIEHDNSSATGTSEEGCEQVYRRKYTKDVCASSEGGERCDVSHGMLNMLAV